MPVVLRARYIMYFLTTGFTYINYMTWYGLITNGWIAFAAAANSWTAQQQALLMGSFAIGCACSLLARPFVVSHCYMFAATSERER